MTKEFYMAYAIVKVYRGWKVKKWFLEKLNKENKKTLWGGSVYAIFKETENAVLAMVADSFDFIISWIPNSCLERGGSRWGEPVETVLHDNKIERVTVEEAIKFWKNEDK